MTTFEQVNQPDRNARGLNSALESSRNASVEAHTAMQTQAVTGTVAQTDQLVASGELPTLTVSTDNSARLTRGKTHPLEIQPVTDAERQTAQGICAALKSGDLSSLERLVKGENPDELRHIADLVNSYMQLGKAFGCRVEGGGLLFSLDGTAGPGGRDSYEVNLDVDSTIPFAFSWKDPENIPGVVADTMYNGLVEPAKSADFFDMLHGLLPRLNSNASATDSSAAPEGRRPNEPSSAPAVRTESNQPGFGQVVRTEYPANNNVEYTVRFNGATVTEMRDGLAVWDQNGVRQFGSVQTGSDGSPNFMANNSIPATITPEGGSTLANADEYDLVINDTYRDDPGAPILRGRLVPGIGTSYRIVPPEGDPRPLDDDQTLIVDNGRATLTATDVSGITVHGTVSCDNHGVPHFRVDEAERKKLLIPFDGFPVEPESEEDIDNEMEDTREYLAGLGTL